MLGRFDRLAQFTIRFLHNFFFTSRRLLADILHTSLGCYRTMLERE